ncbi:MAG TPA: hypothetical protein VJ397_04750, partial [Thermoplasmata archaeon]|nr:hypothetical protein [Thermoplasmata archaeon]
SAAVVLGPWPATGLLDLAVTLLIPGGRVTVLGQSGGEPRLREEGECIVAGCRQRGLEAVFREVDLKAPTALEAVSREHDLVIFGTPPPRAFAGAVPFIRQLRGLPGPVVVFRPAPAS